MAKARRPKFDQDRWREEFVTGRTAEDTTPPVAEGDKAGHKDSDEPSPDPTQEGAAAPADGNLTASPNSEVAAEESEVIQEATNTTATSEEGLRAEIRRLQQELDRTQQLLDQARSQSAASTTSPGAAQVEVDIKSFLNELKSFTPKGTYHSVSESLGSWLRDVQSKLHAFGRTNGPNQQQYLWNLGLLLLRKGLERTPDWDVRLLEYQNFPDLALVECYKLALQGLRMPD